MYATVKCHLLTSSSVPWCSNISVVVPRHALGATVFEDLANDASVAAAAGLRTGPVARLGTRLWACAVGGNCSGDPPTPPTLGEPLWRLVAGRLDDVLVNDSAAFLLFEYRDVDGAWPRGPPAVDDNCAPVNAGPVAWRSSLRRGSRLDARDKYGVTYEAVVVGVTPATTVAAASGADAAHAAADDADDDALRVRFVSWSAAFDEAIPRSSDRLSRLHTVVPPWRDGLRPGDRLEVNSGVLQGAGRRDSVDMPDEGNGEPALLRRWYAGWVWSIDFLVDAEPVLCVLLPAELLRDVREDEEGRRGRVEAYDDDGVLVTQPPPAAPPRPHVVRVPLLSEDIARLGVHIDLERNGAAVAALTPGEGARPPPPPPVPSFAESGRWHDARTAAARRGAVDADVATTAPLRGGAHAAQETALESSERRRAALEAAVGGVIVARDAARAEVATLRRLYAGDGAAQRAAVEALGPAALEAHVGHLRRGAAVAAEVAAERDAARRAAAKAARAAAAAAAVSEVASVAARAAADATAARLEAAAARADADAARADADRAVAAADAEREAARAATESAAADAAAAQTDAERLRGDAAHALEASRCIVCIDARRAAVLLPCRHLCLCVACAAAVRALPPARRACPICRTPVADMFEPYY